MAESADVTTIVNSETSRDNVRRMAGKAGWNVTVEEKESDYYLHFLGEGVEEKAAATRNNHECSPGT